MDTALGHATCFRVPCHSLVEELQWIAVSACRSRSDMLRRQPAEENVEAAADMLDIQDKLRLLPAEEKVGAATDMLEIQDMLRRLPADGCRHARYPRHFESAAGRGVGHAQPDRYLSRVPTHHATRPAWPRGASLILNDAFPHRKTLPL